MLDTLHFISPLSRLNIFLDIIEQSVVMASMTINSVNFTSAKAVNLEYVGLKPLKMHQNTLCVRPQSIRFAPKVLTIRAGESRDDGGHIKKTGKSNEECEAAVVAGNIPEAPPAPQKPAAPSGTPVVPSLVSKYIIWLD